MSEIDPTQLRDLVDRIALVFENSGYPPITGRVLGFLMVCEPAEQSSSDLATYLHASKGAISQSTRMLMKAGLIERVRVPGSRASWFRMRPNAWSSIMHQEMARLRHMRELAEHGLDVLAAAPEDRRARLQEFRDMHAFFEEEFPEMLERWEQKNHGRSR